MIWHLVGNYLFKVSFCLLSDLVVSGIHGIESHA